MTGTDRADLVAQLTLHEGMRLKPYTDTVGKMTIGVGRNLTDVGITREEALDLLSNDIDTCVTDLISFSWFVTLDPVRQRALCDLRFNLGPRRFRGFVKMLAAIEHGDFETAANELTASQWALQVQQSRRMRLVSMLRTGVA